MIKKTVRDIDLKGKTVLVRVDFNVPVKDGEVGDILRLQAALPTLRYLHDQNCRQVLISHLGRPKGEVDPKYTLKPVAAKLAELMGHPVEFGPDCIGEEITQQINNLPEHGIILLENLRFHPEEEANDEEFAARLAQHGEVFVQDGFAVVHRAHASTAAVTHHLPSVAGLLLEREVDTITRVVNSPRRPLLAIVGGAKIADKIEVLNTLLEKAQRVMIGGAMANTFLKAKGCEIGNSLHEADSVQMAHRVMHQAEKAGVELLLPIDVAVAPSTAPEETSRVIDVMDIKPADWIMDVGPQTIMRTINSQWQPGTVLWNGPLGMTELVQYRAGSEAMARAIIGSGAYSVVGGGDTAAFVDSAGLHDQFSFVSTGGGASLELIAGRSLPGVAALADK